MKAVAERMGYEALDGAKVIFIPIVTIVTLTVANIILAEAKIVKYGYISPYVAAVAILSNRVCVRAGLISALVAIPLYNFFIMPPTWAFSLPSVAEATAYISMLVVAVVVAPRVRWKEPPLPLTHDKSKPLPFTRKGRGGDAADTLTWDPSPSMVWATDDYIGREYGRIYVECLRDRTPETPPLSFIASDMVKRGAFTGVEAGFMHVVERAAASKTKRDDHLIPHDYTKDRGSHRAI